MGRIAWRVGLVAPAVVLLAIVALSGQATTDAGNILPQPVEKIVYRCSPGPGFDVCMVNPDGSGYQQLTDDSTGDTWARISPDGQSIVWQRNGIDLWMMNADGSGKKELLPNVNTQSGAPTWSPDGGKIAFICNNPQQSTQQGICTMNRDGSGFEFILETDERATNLEWSPAGNRMLVEFETQSINDDIFILDLNTLALTNITNTPGEWEHGTWSPDGSKIAFVGTPLPAEPVSVAGLYVINPDGSGRERLYTSQQSATATSPTWSPDGQQIAYFCNFTEVCIVDAETGALNDTLMEDFADKYSLGDHPDWGLTGGVRFGDVDCNGSIAATDGLKILQHVAGLGVSQSEPCPDIGSQIGAAVAGGDVSTWGDVNCDGGVGATDALAVLRWIAGLSVQQAQPCPAIGTLLTD